MSIQLMTDGGADLTRSLKEKLDIIVVPLYLHFAHEQYRTGIDLETFEFYEKMKSSAELPRSSAPSPNDFYEAFKGIDPDKPILMLTLSKGLSTTYDNAVSAKELLLEEEPDRQIAVINSKTAACGQTLLLHEAGEKIKEGWLFEDLIEHLSLRVQQTKTLFVLKTLENLIKGGRLDKVKGTIAKTLNIKLLMKGTEDDGTIDVTEKVRGDKKSIRRFVDQIADYTKQFENKIMAMTHTNDETRGKKVLSEIMNKYPFKESLLMESGPLVAAYAGEGGLVISFFGDPE